MPQQIFLAEKKKDEENDHNLELVLLEFLMGEEVYGKQRQSGL